MSDTRRFFPWRYAYVIALHHVTIAYLAYSFKKLKR